MAGLSATQELKATMTFSKANCITDCLFSLYTSFQEHSIANYVSRYRFLSLTIWSALPLGKITRGGRAFLTQITARFKAIIPHSFSSGVHSRLLLRLHCAVLAQDQNANTNGNTTQRRQRYRPAYMLFHRPRYSLGRVSWMPASENAAIRMGNMNHNNNMPTLNKTTAVSE